MVRQSRMDRVPRNVPSLTSYFRMGNNTRNCGEHLHISPMRRLSRRRRLHGADRPFCRSRSAASSHVSAAIGASACSSAATTTLHRDLMHEACRREGAVGKYRPMPNLLNLILTPQTPEGVTARDMGVPASAAGTVFGNPR